MYQSKISISTENRKNLEQKFLLFLSSNNYTYCKSLKRKVSFKKLPEAILNRQESAGSRLRRFFVAVDILKSEKTIKVREHQ